VPLRAAYERWMRPYADRWVEVFTALKGHLGLTG
jgi:hypothetical protein